MTPTESEEHYRTLFARAGEGILLLSVDGKPVEVNEAFARMHGYSKQEMPGLALRDLDAPEISQWAPERMRRILDGETLTFEVERHHRDGHVFPLEVSANVISSGGKSYIQCFYRDITLRKREEKERQNLAERLRRAERMEALVILASGVAHDLNNVLGSLFVYTEMLLERIPEGDPLRVYAGNILSSGEKGAAIVQDLLTVASGNVIPYVTVNMNSVVSGCFETPEFEKLEARHPRVRFRLDLSAELLSITGSPPHLEKTVMNLLSNAAEAISGTGEVTIRTENRYLDRPVHGYDAVTEGGYVVLTVSDTGGGISTAEMDRIFEPFYTKKVMRRGGTGLGLAIVWGTVKNHDGYIDVGSEAGKGSSFTLYFPITREGLAKNGKNSDH